jgi:hypothetical protein
LFSSSTEAAGTTCATGGVRIDGGYDADGSGGLDGDEIVDTAYVCKGAEGEDGAAGAGGADGADGTDGENADALLFSSTVILPGTVCETGGSSLAVGYDLENNSGLAETEIVSRRPVCNGEPGDLFSARPVVQAFSPSYSIPLNATRNISELDLVAAVDGYAVVSATFSVVCSESSTNPCAPVGGTPSWSFILTSLNNKSETGVPSSSGPYGPEYRETVQTTRVFSITAGTTRYRLFGRNSNGDLSLGLENVTLVAQFIPAGDQKRETTAMAGRAGQAPRGGKPERGRATKRQARLGLLNSAL